MRLRASYGVIRLLTWTEEVGVNTNTDGESAKEASLPSAIVDLGEHCEPTQWIEPRRSGFLQGFKACIEL